jgi:AcrR family transcriptional regulator
MSQDPPAIAPPADLSSALLDEAYSIIQSDGLDRLSIREVARRCGVSHQAPYRHYPSRDHILAALVARLYQEFATALAAVPALGNPYSELIDMGWRYLEYAAANPLKYRLMFNTTLPPAADHPAMMDRAADAFGLLQARLAAMPLRASIFSAAADVKGDAIFIWSTLHGLASIQQSDATQALHLSQADRIAMTHRVFARMADAIFPG